MNERDRAILAFEDADWWVYEGAKAEAVIIAFDISLTRYYQILQRLLSDPDAQREFPVTINRLRRIAGSNRRGLRRGRSTQSDDLGERARVGDADHGRDHRQDDVGLW